MVFVSGFPSDSPLSLLYAVLELNEEPPPVLTPEEMAAQRKVKLQERKMHIAALASAILSDPENNVGSIYLTCMCVCLCCAASQ